MAAHWKLDRHRDGLATLYIRRRFCASCTSALKSFRLPTTPDFTQLRPTISVERVPGRGEYSRARAREILLIVPRSFCSMPLNSIPVCIHMEKHPSVCPQCGSTAWVAPGLCLHCMLSLGIGARGESSETLDALLTQMHIDETDFLPCNSATADH